jgi:hypothetical protein
LRDIISGQGTEAFPVTAIEDEMTRRGKTLSFAQDELDDLVDLEYGETRTFALLTLIFESVDTNKALHVDHIFPHSLFKRRRLVAEGIPEERVEDIIDAADRLPNLQLMEGAINQEKLATLPKKWLNQRETSRERREKYMYLHLLEGLPDELNGFEIFYARRRDELRLRINDILGTAS